MSTQKALVVVAEYGPLVVQDVEIYEPGPGELLIEVKAAGLNPADWKIVQEPKRFQVHKAYPAMVGLDAAGIVKEVGEGVDGFAVGDRVVYQGTFVNRNSAFQQYTVGAAEIVSKLPDNITFEEAATLPVAVTTAAYGLYSTKPNGGVGLTPVWEEGGRGKYAGQSILVIGGSSAVGQQVLQFAKLSGFSPIIATASAHNAALLRSLGATHVLDRKTPLAEGLTGITAESIKVVYDAISEKETQNAGYEVLAPGGTLVTVLKAVVDESKIDGTKRVVHVQGSPHDPSQRALGVSLWGNLTKLIQAGDIKPNKVEIIPNGLAGIPDALENIKAGKVSAYKYIAQPWQT